ncbi:MAG: FecR domain-containing protein [Verrucomicrobiota bacterium]
MRISSTWRSVSAFTITAFLLCGRISAADLSEAVVRQKVNVVTLAPSLSAAARPIAQGSVVRDENVVRTGTESRAELEFSDQTLARMGSNSIFSFDAQARALNFTKGALLFSKPASSGRVEVRAGAITAAITGSTGFISNLPVAVAKKKSRGPTGAEEGSTMLGMLEGKLKGNAAWRDASGKEQNMRFALGPGEMLVAQPGQRPVVVQFDLPRFIRTSPLITKFNHPLLNAGELSRAVAAYEADERHGFIDRSNVMVTTQPQVAWVGYNSPNHNSFDASVQQLGSSSSSPSGGFVDVGGTGVLRGQLIWTSTADLDLHLILSNGQEVFYANPTVVFNNGRATAMLDHDNLGGTIDLQPNIRVENIFVTGVPSAGIYNFFVHSFSTPNATDAFTLRVLGGGRTQLLTGTLSNGQNSGMVTVNFTPGRR